MKGDRGAGKGEIIIAQFRPGIMDNQTFLTGQINYFPAKVPAAERTAYPTWFNLAMNVALLTGSLPGCSPPLFYSPATETNL